MKISTYNLTLVSMLAAIIAVSGSLRVPTGIPGSEFQLSAPIAVAIAAAFGFWRYLAAGVLASSILFLLGIHNILNVEVAMVFRVTAGGLIAVLGTRLPIVAVAGPLGSFTARWVLAATLQVPFWPLIISAIPGMIFTAITSWPLYRMLKQVREKAGGQVAGKNL
ncbi:hypothetical protein LC040_07385 [Bacillus tianshenii]|nr:hypothetical protein LC040_07385 [Bacillus tianshenii]